MVRIFRHYVSPIKLTLAIVDFLIALSAAFVAEWLRYRWLGLELEYASLTTLAKFALPVFLSPILLGLGAYQSDSIRDMKVFSLRLLIAAVTTAVLLSAFLYLVPILPLWRSILVLGICLAVVFIYIFHNAFLSFAGGKLLGRRVVVIGEGKEVTDLQEYADKATEAGLNIVAVVRAKKGQFYEAVDGGELQEIEKFDQMLALKQVEIIILANEDNSELPIDLLISAKLAGVEIKDRLSFFEQVRGYVALSSVKPEWIIFSDGFRGGAGFERGIKRLMDIAISLVFLITLAPLMLISALLVAFTSKGPVFYKQERVGLQNQVFDIYKFRSMVVDAEKHEKPQWALEKDPRITPVGRFLRRTRLDELPQLFNVLSGNMSFVGPRPERPYFVEKLNEAVPYYRERHCVKPGITGWAQIQYPYGASVEDSRRKLEYDLYYIKNFSIFLDVLIILQTVRVILFPIGVR